MRLGWSDQKLRAKNITIYTFVYYALPRCPADHLCSDFVTACVVSAHTLLLGTHKDSLAFTLQKMCGQMRPRPSQQVVWVIVSQSVLVVVYACI